ncbi:MAG: ABC transporter ATP-binding protein [Bdellovibrionia bacterium]
MAENTECAVVAARLSHSFDARKPILRDLTFQVGQGECLAIYGENGTGKTTLLRILAGLLRPSSGQVSVFGLAPASPRLRSRIGWSPAHDNSFFSRLTGLENLIYFGSLYGLSRERSEWIARAWSEILPLTDALSAPFYLCSTGMKQSLSVCRALLHEPELVLIDEPTRGLSPAVQKGLREALQKRRPELTLVVAVHGYEEALGWNGSVLPVWPRSTGVEYSGEALL